MVIDKTKEVLLSYISKNNDKNKFYLRAGKYFIIDRDIADYDVDVAFVCFVNGGINILTSVDETDERSTVVHKQDGLVVFEHIIFLTNAVTGNKNIYQVDGSIRTGFVETKNSSISIIPMKYFTMPDVLANINQGKGRSVYFSKDVLCEYKNGIIKIGDIIIDTNN